MENYTKMMDAALKQGLIKWDEPKVGDWTDKGLVVGYSRYPHKSKLWVIRKHFMDREEVWSDKVIFKPSIEQLMEMVDLFKYEYLEIVPLSRKDGFVLLYTREGSEGQEKITAKTQKELWLAFVMHELHGLKWEDGKWIKPKTKERKG